MPSPGPGYNYVAMHDLYVNGVHAFQPGMWVPDSTIASQGWTVGTDVSAPGAVVPSPTALTGRACSLDGTQNLPTPSGVGLEFVVGADGLDDIRFNGVSL
jgi:hypothetical protein